jgi:hypothetical protein
MQSEFEGVTRQRGVSVWEYLLQHPIDMLAVFFAFAESDWKRGEMRVDMLCVENGERQNNGAGVPGSSEAIDGQLQPQLAVLSGLFQRT